MKYYVITTTSTFSSGPSCGLSYVFSESFTNVREFDTKEELEIYLNSDHLAGFRVGGITDKVVSFQIIHGKSVKINTEIEKKVEQVEKVTEIEKYKVVE
jgi:hypothetical protein